MALFSNTVSVGDTCTASQYNNLRKDVLTYGGDYAVATGSANAYVLDVDNQYVLQAGTQVKFKANFVNTGSATINVESTGVKTIKKPDGSTLAAGDIQNNQVCNLFYDGTDYILISAIGQITDNLNFDYPAGENIDGTTTPVAVYVSDGTGGRTAGRVYKSDADDSTNEAREFVGFVKDNVTTGNNVNVKRGVVSGFSSLTVGSFYWVTNTAGAFSATAGTAEIPVGKAISATQIDTMQRPPGMMYISSTTGITKPAKGGNTTTTAPGIARYALIDCGQASVILAKIGGSSMSDINGYSNATNDAVGMHASWAGTTITLYNDSMAGTSSDIGNFSVYYYR